MLFFIAQSINLRAEVSPATVSATYNWMQGFSSFSRHQDSFAIGPDDLFITDNSGMVFGNGSGSPGSSPFIHIYGKTRFGDLNEKIFEPSFVAVSIQYEWKVTSKDGSSDRVPVHVHTEGSVSSHYNWKAFETAPFSDSYYNVEHGNVSAGVRVYFVNENSPAGMYGVYTGNYSPHRVEDYASTEIVEISSFTGQVKSGSTTGFGNFTEDLDFRVTPGKSNAIYLQATFEIVGPSVNPRYGMQWHDFDAFIDPIITIDPAYADRYTLEVSYIPYVPLPVPEPESYLLLLAGLGVILVASRRSSQLS